MRSCCGPFRHIGKPRNQNRGSAQRKHQFRNEGRSQDVFCPIPCFSETSQGFTKVVRTKVSQVRVADPKKVVNYAGKEATSSKPHHDRKSELYSFSKRCKSPWKIFRAKNWKLTAEECAAFSGGRSNQETISSNCLSRLKSSFDLGSDGQWISLSRMQAADWLGADGTDSNDGTTLEQASMA